MKGKDESGRGEKGEVEDRRQAEVIRGLRGQVEDLRAKAEAGVGMRAEEREGWVREGAVYKQMMEERVKELQGRCEELERERAEWKGRATQGRGGGAVEGKKKGLMEGMTSERELIRESYAAILGRKDEEMEGWKAMREREKAEEERTRTRLYDIVRPFTGRP